MAKKTDKDFIKKLKSAMCESGFNQVSLAKKLGLKSASVSKWIRGENNPKLSTLEKISEATGKPLNYFFADGGDNIVAGRDNNANKSSEIKDLQLLKAEMEIIKKEIENINLKIELLKKKK